MRTVSLFLILVLCLSQIQTTVATGQTKCPPRTKKSTVCPMFVTDVCVFHPNGTSTQIKGNGCVACKDPNVLSYTIGECKKSD